MQERPDLIPTQPGGINREATLRRNEARYIPTQIPLGTNAWLLSVYSRYGLHARRVANATFYTEGFSSFVASATASIATEWSEPVPGRVSPAVDHHLSRRTRLVR